MKIIYLITKLELGGAQKICLSLFNHFAPNSYLLSSSDGYLIKEVENNNFFISIKSLGRPLDFWKDIKAFFEIYFILRGLKKKYQRIALHTHSSKAGILGRLAGYLAGCDLIIHTVHGFGFDAIKSKILRMIVIFVEQLAVYCSSKIICVSEKDIQTGSQLFFAFHKKAILIRAAVDDKPFLRNKYLSFRNQFRNFKYNRLIIGTISCLKPQKNLLDMLKMIYLLKKILPPSFQLILEIIGEGEDRFMLEKMVLKYKLKTNVIFLGWQENVIKKMKYWNVFCLTSLWEGLPCSVVQARMLNIWTICYDVGGISEVLTTNRSGVLIPVGRFNLMAVSILNQIINFKNHKNIGTIYYEKINEFKLSSMLKRHELALADK